jgi:hypothetical protein
LRPTKPCAPSQGALLHKGQARQRGQCAYAMASECARASAASSNQVCVHRRPPQHRLPRLPASPDLLHGPLSSCAETCTGHASVTKHSPASSHLHLRTPTSLAAPPHHVRSVQAATRSLRPTHLVPVRLCHTACWETSPHDAPFSFPGTPVRTGPMHACMHGARRPGRVHTTATPASALDLAAPASDVRWAWSRQRQREAGGWA